VATSRRLADDCQPWEYRDLPGAADHVEKRTRAVLVEIATDGFDLVEHFKDTRPIHRRLFRNLTPPTHPAYAGGYRGDLQDECLRICWVSLDGNRSGAAPDDVARDMRQWGEHLEEAVKVLDALRLPPPRHLVEVASVTASLYAGLLRVHPYANGNTHVARLMVTAMLRRYGFYLTGFDVHPRPPENLINDALREYFGLRKARLVQYFIDRSVRLSAS